MNANDPLAPAAAHTTKGSAPRGSTEIARLGDAPEFAAALARLAEIAREPFATRSWLLGHGWRDELRPAV